MQDHIKNHLHSHAQTASLVNVNTVHCGVHMEQTVDVQRGSLTELAEHTMLDLRPLRVLINIH